MSIVVAGRSRPGVHMSRESRFKLGWLLGVACYAFPLVVGTGWYLRLVPPMLTGTAEYRALVHIGLANLVFTGLAGIVFCTYGLRRRIAAFWYLHLIFLLWVVTNDAFAAVRAGWFPMPVFPGALGIIALLLTSSCLRRPHVR